MQDKRLEKSLTAGDKGAAQSVQRHMKLLQEVWTTQGSAKQAQRGRRSANSGYHSKRKGQSLLEKTELQNEENKGEKCQDVSEVMDDWAMK